MIDYFMKLPLRVKISYAFFPLLVITVSILQLMYWGVFGAWVVGLFWTAVAIAIAVLIIVDFHDNEGK